MGNRRIFAALYPPEEVREALLDPMEALPGARWINSDDLHVTLRFVGEVDRRTLDDIVSSLEQVRFEPFDVDLAGVGHFEHRGRVKAIWARVVPSHELGELQGCVEQAVRRAGCAAEARKFIPHVTLARLGRGAAEIGEWLRAHAGLSHSWRAEGFSLFESHLTLSGAYYDEITQFP